MNEQLAFFESDLGRHDAAYESNMRFCEEVEETLKACGYTLNSNLVHQKSYIKNSTFTDLYGAKRHSAFVVHHPNHGEVRIEVHSQRTTGSVDMKFPFFLESLKLASEPNACILLGGTGYKRLAFEWLIKAAEQCTHKKIKVFNSTDSFADYLCE